VAGQQVGTVAPRGPMADLVASIVVSLTCRGSRWTFNDALGETRPTFEGSKRDTPSLQHSNTPIRGRQRARERERFHCGSKTNDNLDEGN